MSIEFMGKTVTTHVGYRVKNEPWSDTPWSLIMSDRVYTNQALTITCTDGELNEVEVRAASHPSMFVVISPEEIANVPAWLAELVKRTVELA